MFCIPIGELAVKTGVVSREVLQQALDLQMRFLALYLAKKSGEEKEEREKPPPDGSSCGQLYEKLQKYWDDAIAEYSVSEENIKTAAEQIRKAYDSHDSAIAGMPAPHVPAMGELIIDIGKIKTETISALLTAQAAHRIITAVRNMLTDGHYAQFSLEDIKRSPVWERIKEQTEPQYLVGSQQMLLAVKSLQAATTMNPALAYTDIMKSAKAAFVIVGLATFQEAAQHLPEAISTQVKNLIKQENMEWKTEIPVSAMLLNTALNNISRALDAADISLGQQYAEELIRQRLRSRSEQNDKNGMKGDKNNGGENKQGDKEEK